MKRINLFFLLIACGSCCFGQNNNTIIRHDTTLLKAEECQWILSKTDAGGTGQSVSSLIIDAIVAGKLKAIDYNTGEKIPADKFLTWQQPADTTMVYDQKLEKESLRIIQKTIDPERFTKIRIYHDWLLDNSSGKIQAVLTRVVLMLDIFSPDGTLRGITPFCRVE